MKTVKALTFDTAQDSWEGSTGFVLRDIPMPTLDEAADPADATSVILKIRYAGFCGTDRGIWYRNVFHDLIHDSLKAQGQTQRVLGHEFVGEIIEAGSMVHTLYYDPDPANPVKIEVGSLVSGDSHVTCGKCYQCRIGEANVCMNESILGISINGIFAEYVKVPAKNLWAIDESRIRPEIAAVMDPFGNAVHAVTKVDVRGQRVAVMGCGPIGLFAILLLKNFGAAKIIAVDINPDNLAMAKELGAHETIQIEKKSKEHDYDHDPEVIDRIHELTYGKGVDVAMEMAGPPSSLNNALEATRRGGQVVLFGLKDGDFTIPKFSRFIVKGLTVHGIIGRRIFETWQISQRILSDRSNGIQDKMWDVILKGGQGTIVPLAQYNPKDFEQSLNAHPKIVIKIGG
ncbi:MAG TPA: zinc-binding dehydrogenase [Candidatus Saccharimonadia bacterium]|nr:zinc-binding dehydrogenase [Candidatus Saccharimonadia bacterium]